MAWKPVATAADPRRKKGRIPLPEMVGEGMSLQSCPPIVLLKSKERRIYLFTTTTIKYKITVWNKKLNASIKLPTI